MTFKANAATDEIKRHLISKLAVIIGNASNGLHDITTFEAPFVNLFELCAHQSTVAEFRRGAHKFRPTNAEFNSFIGPCLRNEIQGRDDSSRGCLFDNGEIA